MSLGWRFYARRPVSGDWLWTDVPLKAEVTDENGGPGYISGFLAAAADQETASDGRPTWIERGTLLYAEQGGQLEHGGVFVCTHQQAVKDGRHLEFVGLSGALEWMPFDDEYVVWNPHPYDVVEAMLAHAQSYPNGNLGFKVKRVNEPPRKVGDEKPPAKPAKPPRRDGESAEDYDDRLLAWEMAVDDWEEEYGYREPYQLVWWEAPFIGDELASIAQEVPFDYRETHRWTDRDTLRVESLLELGGRLGSRREDIRLVDGVNLIERPQPATNGDDYANDLILLGAGEGRAMRRARVAVNDGRIRSSRYVSYKNVRNLTRLRNLAHVEQQRSAMRTTLESVTVWDVGGYAPVTSLRPGDEVWVESRRSTPAYGAWRRIATRTRYTDSPKVVLKFVPETAGEAGVAYDVPESPTLIETDPVPPPIPVGGEDPPVYPDPNEQPPGAPAPKPAPPAAGPAVFRVAWANMAWQLGHNKDLVRWLCERADIIMLNEAKDFTLANLLPKGWTSLQNTASTEKSESCLAYRTAAFEKVANVTTTLVLTGGAARGFPDRYVQYADFTVGGKTARVATAHYPRAKLTQWHKPMSNALRPILKARPNGRPLVFGSDVNQQWRKAADQLNIKGSGRDKGGIVMLGRDGDLSQADFRVHPVREGTDKNILTARYRIH